MRIGWTGRAGLLGAFVLLLVLPATAADPQLDPLADVYSLPEYGIAAQATITASDADPGDVVTFALVDPADGSPSPLAVHLTPKPPQGSTHSALLFWEATVLDAGIYPLRVVATDATGGTDQIDFTLRVYPGSNDITIHAIDGPVIFEVNSAGNPGPYAFTVDATSTAGLELEYQLETYSPSGVLTSLAYQSSNSFDVTLDEVGLWSLIARARSELTFGAVSTLVRTAYAYAPGEVTPPGSLATLALSGAGRITAGWTSNPANTTITEYRLTLRTVANISTPVLDTLAVADPANEPAGYQFTYDFTDPARPGLLQMLADINTAFAPASNTELSQVTLEIEAVTDDPGDPSVYLPIGPTILLREQFPHLESIETEYTLQPRSVTIRLGQVVLPGGFYSADEVRIYRGAFGDDPTLYQVIPAPRTGATATLLDASSQPIPSGAATGQLFATVVDHQTASPAQLEGVLVKHTLALDPPQCWDGVDNDADGLQDLDGGDPGCSAQLDTVEYDSFDELPVSDRALIVYNVNTIDAASIAEYYRAARGLPASSLCPVELPPGNFADPAELVGARKTIVETCICQNVMGLFPFECDAVAADALAAASPVTHLVLIKGIPHRLANAAWSSAHEDPSFDYYLAYAVYHEPTLFDPGTSGSVTHGPYDGSASDLVDYQPLYPLTARARPIDPWIDRMLAYGRVEAMDTARTFELIDRTLAAEAQGVTGNFLEQGVVSNWEFLARMTTTRDIPGQGVVCDAKEYLGVLDAEWPHAHCRAGSTASGLIPGEPPNSGKVQNIPHAVNAGAYFGRGLIPGGHNAFRGFDNLLQWRRVHPDDEAVPCEPLCRDYADGQTVADCRAASTDFFREIDTACVGVAPGFLGWQLRSWPVQYYGFQPPGWTLNANGAQEKTMPFPMTGSPFGDRYMHYGALDTAVTPTCTAADGSVFACAERVAIDLEHTLNLDPQLVLSADKEYDVRFRYRRGGGTTGTMRVLAQFRRDDDQAFNSFVDYSVAQPQAEWTEAAVTLTAPVDASPVKRIRLLITSVLGNNLRGWIDLDQVELHEADDPSQTNLIEADVASFERPYVGPTHGGDWAANVIDRLGGVAWWGSGSHFLTGGWAFSEIDRTIGAFYSGRTLGESLLITGGRAKSGTIYGDPLYRPSGAKLYLDDGLVRLNEAAPGYTFVENDPSSWDPQIHRLKINAFHGQSNLATTRWSVSRCFGTDIDACFDAGAWVELESNVTHGVNAVVAHPLQADLLELIDPAIYYADQDVIVRLRVWNPADEDDAAGSETHDNDLTSYGFLHYFAADNHAPGVENPAILPAPPSVTEDLVASYDFVDVDADAEDGAGRSVIWFLDGAPQPALDGQLVVSASMTAVGQTWHFEIVVSDGSLASPVATSSGVTVACLGPDQPLTIVSAELDANGDVRLHVADPNPPTRVTGYAIHRGGQAAQALERIASDVPDEDNGTSGVQLTDVGSAATAPLFYRVGAVSSLCGIDGPLAD